MSNDVDIQRVNFLAQFILASNARVHTRVYHKCYFTLAIARQNVKYRKY